MSAKDEVNELIEKKLARRKHLNKDNNDQTTVQKHVMNFMKWADSLSKEIKNKDARKFSIGGRLSVLESKLRSVDQFMKYEVSYDDEHGTLDEIRVRWSSRARKADPNLPEEQIFKIEDIFLSEIGLV